jgi:hypothetical protein
MLKSFVVVNHSLPDTLEDTRKEAFWAVTSHCLLKLMVESLSEGEDSPQITPTVFTKKRAA